MENQNSHPSKFVKWSLIVGIVIVINMFFNYAISLVYKAPEYPVNTSQIIGTIYTKDECISIGGQWTQAPTPTDLKTADPQSKLGGYCDPDYTKRMEYEKYRKEYSRDLFTILVALGALIMGFGIVLKDKLEVLAIAFSWGGVLSFIIASMRYWSDANNGLKVAILAVALASLMYLAVKKFAK